MRLAVQDGKQVLLYFCRPGCVWCSKVELTDCSSKSTANLINDIFMPIKINGWSKEKYVTPSGELSGFGLVIEFQLTGHPAVWFLESYGSKIIFLRDTLRPMILNCCHVISAEAIIKTRTSKTLPGKPQVFSNEVSRLG